MAEVEPVAKGAPDTWGKYVRGVTWAIREAYGPIPCGFEAALAGDVPLGAGLSSSASLQAAFALFLAGSGPLGRPGRGRPRARPTA